MNFNTTTVRMVPTLVSDTSMFKTPDLRPCEVVNPSSFSQIVVVVSTHTHQLLNSLVLLHLIIFDSFLS